MGFFNTSSPTPSTLNTINSISPDIRDYILSKNIKSTYPTLSPTVNGSVGPGQPVLDTESNFLNTFPHFQFTENTSTLDILGSVINGQGIGIASSKTVVPNFDIRSSLAGRILGATGLLKDSKLGTVGAQQLALALANNAAFNVQQELLGLLNVKDNVSALIKGNPLPGFRPNYKITVPSSTIARIGDVGARMLGFTIPRSYLDDKGSIFQSENSLEGKDVGDIERDNSMILNTGKGQVVALLKNIRANSVLNSPFRSGYLPGFTNNKGVREISEADSKIYAFDITGQNVNTLATLDSDGVFPDLSYNREEKVAKYGFNSPEELGTGPIGNPGYKNRKNSDVGFTWTSQTPEALNSLSTTPPINGIEVVNDELVGDKKSLLVKTQKLFSSKGMKTLVSVKGEMTVNASQTQTTNGGGISKGSAVIQGDRYNQKGEYLGDGKSANDTYCRSWTTVDRYDKVNKLIRHSGLDLNSVYVEGHPFRKHTEHSVLESNGFPKIAPYANDNVVDAKKFMFSIENLAWTDMIDSLPEGEKGPGDLINGHRGRIMWFPPYDITFSENNSVNWESTNFIGRGEPVYSYNNTERTGTLSFKVIVDHPSYINSFRGNNGPIDNYVASYFAGCADPNDYFMARLKERVFIDDSYGVTDPQIKSLKPQTPPPINLKVYFPNDNSDLNPKYENGLTGSSPTSKISCTSKSDGDGHGLGWYTAKYTTGIHKIQQGWNDITNYGLNNHCNVVKFTGVDGIENSYNGWTDRIALFTEVEKYLKSSCEFCVCNVDGFASQQGRVDSNNKLVDDRADEIINILMGLIFQNIPRPERIKRFIKNKKNKDIAIPDNPNCRRGVEEDIPKEPCKLDRRTEISFSYDNNLAIKALGKKNIENKKLTQKIITRVSSDYYNELNYFERLKQEDPFIFDSFRERIKYFHPAFHSTTPEGLNTRLNFLLQCTRQGPIFEKNEPNNLAFGRPPICILRIGDFYNTKIAMDSVNITYDPLVWDLNPEGIGVQPMIANVDISFKFLGGSTLSGPINKLQNALSFNYFANAQVYDTRADYIIITTEQTKDSKGETIAGKDFLSGKIKDGKLKVEGDKYTKTVVDVPLDTDQVANNEQNIAGTQTSGLTTTANGNSIDDDAVIKNIVFDGVATYNGENINLNFKFKKNTDGKDLKLVLDPTLNKTYKGFVYLTNTADMVKNNLQTIYIVPNGPTGVIFRVKLEDSVNEIVVGTNTDIWTINAALGELEKDILNKVTEFSKSGNEINLIKDYSIKIEWDTSAYITTSYKIPK